MTSDPSDLASFDSRYTMRFVRVFPQPIERVWEAVTRAEQLDVWLMPVTEIDLVEPRPQLLHLAAYGLHVDGPGRAHRVPA